MRFEREINIKFDHSCRTQDLRTIETDIRLVFDYEVITSANGVRLIDITHTQQRVNWNTYDGQWFWDLCPHGLRARLDSEMLAAWDACHGLVVERVTA